MFLRSSISFLVVVCFFLTTLGPICPISCSAEGEEFRLPTPGTMVNLSPAYQPVIIKGLTVHKDNPFLFDFIVDVGQDRMSGEPLKKEGEKLIKYFLAGLAIPDKDLWVNLSPYEKNRMIPEVLGQTDMGRDLLEEDYILKQITASLIYPEKQLGKTFWDKVYAKAQAMYGTTQVPVNTFNKVWIMADKAEVFEHNQTAFVVDCHLKVMLEEDYLALSKHRLPTRGHLPAGQVSPSTLPSEQRVETESTPGKSRYALPVTNNIASQIVRSIILPQLEREVNTGKNFANLRQIFNSVILASWYKKNLKEALLNQVYANKSKVKGIQRPQNLSFPNVSVGNPGHVISKDDVELIYEQYLKAYKKGVFNYIKEDVSNTGETMPRKYFSGGVLGIIKETITTDSAVLAAMRYAALVIFSTGLLTQSALANSGPTHQAPVTVVATTAIGETSSINFIGDEHSKPGVIYRDIEITKPYNKTLQEIKEYWKKKDLEIETRNVRMFSYLDSKLDEKKSVPVLLNEPLTVGFYRIEADDDPIAQDAYRKIIYYLEYGPDAAMLTPQPITRPLTYQQAVAVNAIISQPKKYENLFRQPFSYQYSSGAEKIVAVLLRSISRRYRLVKPGVGADLSEIPLARVVMWTATAWQFLLQGDDFKIIDNSGTPVMGDALLPGEIYSTRWVLENKYKGHGQDQLEANRIFENSQDQDVIGARTMVQRIEEIVQEHRSVYIVRLTEDFRDMLGLNHLNPIQQRVAESAFGKRMEDYLNEPIPNSVNVEAWDMLKRNELPFIEYERPDRRMLSVSSQVQFGFTKPERIIVNAVIPDAAMLTSEDTGELNLERIKKMIQPPALSRRLFPDNKIESAAWIIRYHLQDQLSWTAAVDSLVEKAGITKNSDRLKKEDVRRRVEKMLDGIKDAAMKASARLKIDVQRMVKRLLDNTSIYPKDDKAIIVNIEFPQVLDNAQIAAVQQIVKRFLPSGITDFAMTNHGVTFKLRQNSKKALEFLSYWRKNSNLLTEIPPILAMGALHLLIVDVLSSKNTLPLLVAFAIVDIIFVWTYVQRGISMKKRKIFDENKPAIYVALENIAKNIDQTVERISNKESLTVIDQLNLILDGVKQKMEEIKSAYMKGDPLLQRVNIRVLSEENERFDPRVKELLMPIVPLTATDDLISFAVNAKNEAMTAEQQLNVQVKNHNMAPGGIDLNTSSGMQWKVSKDGQGVEMNVDPAMERPNYFDIEKLGDIIARIKREGIDSLSPVIFRITPVANIWSLVGLQAPVPAEQIGASFY